MAGFGQESEMFLIKEALLAALVRIDCREAEWRQRSQEAITEIAVRVTNRIQSGQIKQ